MYINFVDSDSDVTLEWCKKYNFNMISMPYSIDGKEVFPYVDFKKFEYKKYYDLLRGGVLPNTSALNKDTYIKYFEPVLAAGNDVFYIHFSRKMSATFTSMDQAIDELLKKYPERKFLLVNTKAITALSYLICDECARRLKDGMSHEDVKKWVDEEALHFTIYFFADDLKFFKHTGRVSGLAATMGTVIGIRPIIYMNDEGSMVSISKAVGRQKAIDALINYVETLGDHLNDYKVVVGHTDSESIAKEIVQKLKNKFGSNLNIETVIVNPTAGAHCGPNGVGIAFHAIHR